MPNTVRPIQAIEDGWRQYVVAPDALERYAKGADELAALDALLDHIYEYGTTAEGVLARAAKLCQAARAAERGAAGTAGREPHRWLAQPDG